MNNHKITGVGRIPERKMDWIRFDMVDKNGESHKGILFVSEQYKRVEISDEPTREQLIDHVDKYLGDNYDQLQAKMPHDPYEFLVNDRNAPQAELRHEFIP